MKRLSTVLLLSVLALAATGAKTSTSYVCSLTNKKISKCCCTKKDGQLYCTLAQKAITDCCCKPAAATTKNAAK